MIAQNPPVSQPPVDWLSPDAVMAWVADERSAARTWRWPAAKRTSPVRTDLARPGLCSTSSRCLIRCRGINRGRQLDCQPRCHDRKSADQIPVWLRQTIRSEAEEQVYSHHHYQ